jgi:CheY-like chemotaxis protein
MAENKYHFGNVLLVDDSEIDILVNRRLIELTKFASGINAVNSGEDALYFLREECRSSNEAPDWIFLDVYLPGMNGLDFIEEFKNLPSYITNKTKIIILSVFPNKEKLQKAFENNFVAGQLDKPLTQSALKDISENKPIIVRIGK